MANLPTSQIIAPADPNVEGVGSGMNAGSCYPGIGVATNVIDPKVQDWAQIKVQLDNQPIGWGGDSVELGQQDADIPAAKLVDYVASDFNDTPVEFEVADQQAAPGGVYNIAAGTVNHSDQTIEIGEWLWGAVPVA